MYKKYRQGCVKVGARKGPQAGGYGAGTVCTWTVVRPAVLNYTFIKHHRGEKLRRE